MNFRKTKNGILLLLSILLLSGCQWIQYIGTKSTNSMPSSEGNEALVTKVVDGDTVYVLINGKREKIRLLLIDTPEYTTEKEPYGKEAKMFMRNLILKQIVELEYDHERRDRYGRLLAYIYFQDESVQKQLLERGLAKVKVYPPNQKYVKQFRQYEALAQKKEMNIWSSK